MRKYHVYILTNKNNTTFYIGVTNNITRRIYEHKHKLVLGFTSKYNLNKLVYGEEFSLVTEAFAREKQLKNWHREWKLNLVKSINPNLAEIKI